VAQLEKEYREGLLRVVGRLPVVPPPLGEGASEAQI
jgi:hypothetical protein